MGIEFKAPSKPSLIYIFCSGALEVLDRVENTLEQQFNCSICIALPIHPIFLNCGHHNCWLCLFQWKEANQPSICPLCRYRYNLALKSTGTVYTLKPESCTTETNAANIVSVSFSFQRNFFLSLVDGRCPCKPRAFSDFSPNSCNMNLWRNEHLFPSENWHQKEQLIALVSVVQLLGFRVQNWTL